jgi:glycosyltransferase involved in cell wall biosynthesis
MRIAFVAQPWDEVYPPLGGHSSISIIVYQIARRMARSGHEVIIYGKRGHAQPAVERDDEGILYRRIPVELEDLLLKPIKLLDRLGPFRNPKRPFFASSLYFPAYALQIAQDLKEKQADVVHIMNFSQYVPLIRAANANAKFVLHMECEWLSQLDASMIEGRLKGTDLIIGCSDYITTKIRLRFPQFADRCQTVYNGVDPKDFSNLGRPTKRNGEERILFVGRVSPEKGVHILLDAFREVVVRHPQAQLDIVGPIGSVPFDFVVALSDDDHVSRLAAFYSGGIKKKSHYTAHLQKQLPPPAWERVNMVGGVPHSQVVAHYRAADVFAFTSVWDEPFGIPMIEAMACGVPVVAAQGGAVPEIVEDGETGLLVERDNAAALTEAILRLLADQDLRNSMGEAGRARVQRYFTWDRVAADLVNQYTNL